MYKRQVSEDSMSDYMEYLYLKRPMPMTTGVPVTISTIDPNGNMVAIDTVTSDTEGFRVEWTPENEGLHQILATFDGSTSYFTSYGSTDLLVDSAPEATPEPTQAPATQTDTYVLGLGIAALIAIVVMGLLILMKLGKK